MHPFLGGFFFCLPLFFCFLVKVGTEWGIVGEGKEERQEERDCPREGMHSTASRVNRNE